jgi:hypothetical protein
MHLHFIANLSQPSSSVQTTNHIHPAREATEKVISRQQQQWYLSTFQAAVIFETNMSTKLGSFALCRTAAARSEAWLLAVRPTASGQRQLRIHRLFTTCIFRFSPNVALTRLNRLHGVYALAFAKHCNITRVYDSPQHIYIQSAAS